MDELLVGNAPCSWGMLEFEQVKGGERIQFQQMLDELVETGYTGTELGDWGYMSTDSRRFEAEPCATKYCDAGCICPGRLQGREYAPAGSPRCC